MCFVHPTRGVVGKLLALISLATISPRWNLLVVRPPEIIRELSSIVPSSLLPSHLSNGDFSGLAPMMVRFLLHKMAARTGRTSLHQTYLNRHLSVSLSLLRMT